MKIKLLHRYQSAATNEEPLQAGEHELDDSLAQYLIHNGHAVLIVDAVSQVAVDIVKEGAAKNVVTNPTRRRRKKS